MTQQNISTERDRDYGTAWKLTSTVMQLVWSVAVTRLASTPYWHLWYMILVKLIRLLYIPRHLDSWIDIVGYAQLAVDDLEKGVKNETESI
jgi:hypothetical protein